MSTIQLISAEDAEKINTEEKVIRVTINKKGSSFEYRKFVGYTSTTAHGSKNWV